MKNYLVIFREPDGRLESDHTDAAVREHQQNWAKWLEKFGSEAKLAGGSALTLEGKMLIGAEPVIVDGIHKVGTEIVGGFLLLKAEDLDEATEIISSCPIFEFGGYAEVREMKTQ